MKLVLVSFPGITHIPPMGVGSSKPEEPHLKNVFARELGDLTHIINNILTPSNKFVADEYNFLGKNACDRFTFVLESSLKKHLKVEIQELHDSLVLIPKQNRIAVGQSFVDKDTLCDIISTHYVRCLYLLCLVKYVYDLEHGGDYSIAGIVRRNLRLVGDLLEINYCAIPQKDYLRHSKNVDFSNLQGMRFFAEHFLSPEERHTFFEQFRMILAKDIKPDSLITLSCQDSTMTQADYEKIYGIKPTCKQITKKASSVTSVPAIEFPVAAGNPVWSSQLCMSKKKLVVKIGSDKKSKALQASYQKLQDNYIANLQLVHSLLQELVVLRKQKYELKNISGEELDAVTKKVKSTIMHFYLQPLLDFQSIVDLAKSLPSVVRIDVP
jgi:hypothetical protein